MSRLVTSSLEEALRGLEVRPSRGFVDRVVARFAPVAGPVGELYVAWTAIGISWVEVASPGGEAVFTARYRERFGRPIVRATRPLPGLAAAARSGRGRRLAYDLTGLTEFDVHVLEATLAIPVGEVRPYAWVATEIGRPRAVRAVGSALGRNPVPVLIPCHRVTRSDGTIGNYGGGPALKEALLRAERVNLDELAALASSGVHYVGSTTTKIVCLPSCRDVRRVAARHRRGFRDLAEAGSAGYRPCDRCRPGLRRSA
ncbi:MAG: methylated-DNA--[protein]-cysteine S-methyltransferase [Acidimicrobiales bacterium]